MKKLYFFSMLVIFWGFFSVAVKAQINTPDYLSASIYSSVSSKPYQPFWLTVNREGIFDESSKVNGIFQFKAISKASQNKVFDYGYGIDFISRGANHNSTLYLNQVFIKAKASFLELYLGRKSRQIGENTSNLSTGSMAISRNTTPIPMLNISVPEFTPVPFTKEMLLFKGNLAHGWLGDNKSVEGAYLHEKSFYLKLDNINWPIKFYSGIIHFVQWGGTSKNPDIGILPSGAEDYVRIFFGKEGNSNSPGGEQINALGNHLGIWDFGLDIEFTSVDVKGYYQHPFEDRSGLLIRSIEDGLWGINLNTKTKSVFSQFILEFMYTKSQSGPGLSDPPGESPYCEKENCGAPFGGRDNYYNHYIYSNGWVYEGRTLGTPLFLTVNQVNRYLNSPETYNMSIESNRVIGQHVGIGGEITPRLSYRALATYVRHYGNYTGLEGHGTFNTENPNYDASQYEFYPALEQWSFLLESVFLINKPNEISLKAALAYDRGDLTNNVGILIGAILDF